MSKLDDIVATLIEGELNTLREGFGTDLDMQEIIAENGPGTVRVGEAIKFAENYLAGHIDLNPHRVVREFMKWLRDNTDTFDPVMVSALLYEWQDAGAKKPSPLGYSDDEINDLANMFFQTRRAPLAETTK